MSKNVNVKKQVNKAEFYLMVSGRKVIVTEEVYHAYKDPIRAEKKRKQRNWRCRDGKGIRCNGDCENCGYFRNGWDAVGNDVSLDQLYEDTEYEIPDTSSSVERLAFDQLLFEELLKALNELDPQSRRICEFIQSGATDREMAADLHITQSTFNYKKRKLLAKLRKRLAKFR